MPPPAAPPPRDIAGRWILRPEGQPFAVPPPWMIIELEGTALRVHGDGWSGEGTFDGERGSYDWRLVDGRGGRTECFLDEQGELHGQVRGAEFNWDYRATWVGSPAPPQASAIRTFELRDDRSSKFWNIELHGDKFTVTFGKIGTKGQTQTKEFADGARAEKDHAKLIKEKLGKGYVETTPAAAAAAPAKPPAQQALEKALVENPDDLAAHAAYADLLSEQGDPRGEFIQVQLRLEDPQCKGKQRERLQKREQELLHAHARQWLGEMAPFFLDEQTTSGGWRFQFQHRFERGWLAFVRLERLSAAFMPAFNANPLLRLLRHLVVPHRDWGAVAYEEQDDLALLAQSSHLGNVRQFQLGPDDDDPHCHMPGEWAVELVRQMPKLEELRMHAHCRNPDALFALRFPRLRLLQVHHLHHYPLEVLAANATLTNLEHLSLWPHMLEPGDEAPYITLEGARALIHSPNLPRLRVLVLRSSDLGDEGCAEIVGSGLLKRLKVLNLMGGRITDAGARTLAACADLKNLELLNVSQNTLTDAGLGALRATGIRVESAQQLGEGEAYMWEGDME
jgi:uncharacterized protein (TIGR02996 family)